jgi:hypothetical protein
MTILADAQPLPSGFMNLVAAMKDAGSTAVAEGGSHLGEPLAKALLDHDFVTKAARWRGGFRSEEKNGSHGENHSSCPEATSIHHSRC